MREKEVQQLKKTVAKTEEKASMSRAEIEAVVRADYEKQVRVFCAAV